jgi:hypothetical protein
MFLSVLLSIVAAKWCTDTVEIKGFTPKNCPGGIFFNKCYEECKKGYVGVGFVCWEECDKGCQNLGAICFCPPFSFPAKKSYTRGTTDPICSKDQKMIDGLCFRDDCNSYRGNFGKRKYKQIGLSNGVLKCKAEWESGNEYCFA